MADLTVAVIKLLSTLLFFFFLISHSNLLYFGLWFHRACVSDRAFFLYCTKSKTLICCFLGHTEAAACCWWQKWTESVASFCQSLKVNYMVRLVNVLYILFVNKSYLIKITLWFLLPSTLSYPVKRHSLCLLTMDFRVSVLPDSSYENWKALFLIMDLT